MITFLRTQCVLLLAKTDVPLPIGIYSKAIYYLYVAEDLQELIRYNGNYGAMRNYRSTVRLLTMGVII